MSTPDTNGSAEIKRNDLGGMIISGIFILIGALTLKQTSEMTELESAVFPATVMVGGIVFAIVTIIRCASAPDPDTADKAAQKDTDARWTVKIGRPRDKSTERSVPELAIPVFGYKSPIAIDRRFGFIRTFEITDAARHDGKVLRQIVTTDNTASDVWADTAYRSKTNEAWLEKRGRVSRIHRKKPKGKPMPNTIRRGNAAKSTVRAKVEHVFAHQKDRMGLFIRTIGITRAEAKIGLANLAYNMQRYLFHERRTRIG